MADSILLSQTTTINDAGDLVTRLNNDDSFILSLQDGTTKTVDTIELVKEIGRIAGLNVSDVNLAPLENGTIPSQYLSLPSGRGTAFHVAAGNSPGNTSGQQGDLWLSNTSWDLYRLTDVQGSGPSATYVWALQGNIRGTGAAGLSKENVRCCIISRLIQGQYQVSNKRIESTGNISLADASNSDGVTLEVGDRVAYLMSNQSGTLSANSTQSSNHSYNGIYVVTQLGSRSSPYILTRAHDFDSDEDIQPGSSFYVSEGTQLGGTKWILSHYGDIDLDGTGNDAHLQFKREKVTHTQLQNIDWNDDTGTPRIVNKPDIDSIVSEHTLNTAQSNGYYFRNVEGSRLGLTTAGEAKLKDFGERDFSITAVVDFSNSNPTAENTLITTLEGTTYWSSGIRINIDTAGKIVVYLNSTGSARPSDVFKSTATASSVNGRTMLLTVVCDRTNSKLRVYFDGELESESTIPPSVGALRGTDFRLGGSTTEGEDTTLRDVSIRNLAVWDLDVTPKIQYLIASKNTPHPTDQFVNLNVYTSDFSSTNDGWTPINATVSRQSTTISGQAINFLRIKSAGVQENQKSIYSGEILSPSKAFEVQFYVGRIGASTHSNNTRVNGWKLVCGGLSPEPSIGYVVAQDTIRTGANSGVKLVTARFRASSPDLVGTATEDQELRLVLTRNGSTNFSDPAGLDELDTYGWRIRQIGAVEYWASEYVNHRFWHGGFNPVNQLEASNTDLLTDSKNDEGTFTPELQIGNSNFWRDQIHYSTNSGSYRREGNTIKFNLHVACSAIPATLIGSGTNSSGQIRVLTNLPFKSASKELTTFYGIVRNTAGFSTPQNFHYGMNLNDNQIFLNYHTANSIASLSGANASETFEVLVSGTILI